MGTRRKCRIFITTAVSMLISFMLLLTACGGKSPGSAANTEGGLAAETTVESQGSETTSPETTSSGTTSSGTAMPEDSAVSSDNSPEGSGSHSGGQDVTSSEKLTLFHSSNIDLDNDGIKEEIKVHQAEISYAGGIQHDEIEGRLSITGKNGSFTVPFNRKPKGMAEAVSGVEFEDLDGDGAKDIFIVLPEIGASFSLNYFFIYNYKTNVSYNYTIDANLFNFADGFRFKYGEKGKLAINNAYYGFNAFFDISDSPAFNKDDDTSNSYYERAWVDAAPVEISAESRLTLVKDIEGETVIKVPLPVFGAAAADMIGEVDVFYGINKDFVPEIRRFEVIDYNAENHLIIGSKHVATSVR